MHTVARLAALLATLVIACAPTLDRDPIDGEDAPFPDGKADGSIAAGSPEARAILALVNDPMVTVEELDLDAALNKRAATNIIAHRSGDDGLGGTADDDLFDTLDELDEVPYVGPYALEQLLAYAIDRGYLDTEEGKQVDVVFSPQGYDDSHLARVAALIDSAEHSLDIAMYSYSDGTIADALAAAVARGVEVRFVFETGSEDRKLTGSALASSKSGKLEAIGVNVRWVNKIMHHKFMIVDGPRDDASRIDTATVVSGSGNWSYSAGTRYDENTLFFTGYRELTMRMQKEFDHLWAHSRDVAADPSLPYELSTVSMDELGIDDEASTHAYFTSANFTATGDTFRIKRGSSEISDHLVEAILAADRSIHIASGHMRSRPISEAVMHVAATRPDVDIKIYLDGQEYISDYYNNQQVSELDACLAAATTDTQTANCMDKGFYFSYQAAAAGIPLRFKYYAYRWHYSYAEQMHHKYVIIDGDELWTGSYNHSDNAEHNTIENMLVWKGAEFAGLVGAYEANFAALWNTGDGLYDGLMERVATDSSVPLVFDSMALTWDQVTALKGAIRDNCALINSDDYRDHPESHWSCPR